MSLTRSLFLGVPSSRSRGASTRSLSEEWLETIDSGSQANEATVRYVSFPLGQTIYPRTDSHIAMISIGGPSFNSTPPFNFGNALITCDLFQASSAQVRLASPSQN